MNSRTKFHTFRTSLRKAEQWANDLVPTIYNYLILNHPDPSSPLFRLCPLPHEQEALSSVVASINSNIVGPLPQRTRELSRAWQLEEYLLGRIVRSGPTTRCRLLERLLYLHPTPSCIAKLSRLPRTDPEVAFALLLVELYIMPSQVCELLKRHPHPLTLAQMERVVEVLHLRSPLLSPPHIDGLGGDNVDMFLLYIAWAEGIGSTIEQAQRLALSPNRTLRTAAFNILLDEALVATL